MAQVLVNLFQVDNSHYLLMVDHFSRYLMVTRSLTSETMIQQLKHWFNEFGYSQVLQSDDSLQFCSWFAKFCVDNGIWHEVSSPYNSQSNGHVEASMRNIKGLLIEVSTSGFDNVLFAWQNMVESNRVASPIKLFFKQCLLSTWPMVKSPPPLLIRVLHTKIRSNLKLMIVIIV